LKARRRAFCPGSGAASQAQSKAAYLLAVGVYLGKSAAILIREEAVARGERCAFQTFKMDDETYRFVNAVSGVKSIGRVLAAPLHLPLTKHN